MRLHGFICSSSSSESKSNSNKAFIILRFQE
jgi:hypothetical protein